MKKVIKYLRKRLADLKIYTARAGGWISLFNSAMLILVFLKVDDNIVLKKFTIPLIVGWFSLLIFLGWFDIKVAKVMQTESETVFIYQPPMVRMHDGIQELLKLTKENKQETLKFELPEDKPEDKPKEESL